MAMMVATDFSNNSAYALMEAARLARSLETELVVVHVIETLEDSAWMILVEDPGELERHVRAERADRLRAFCEEHIGLERVTCRVEVGRATEVLLRVREELGAEALVVGAQGRGPVAAILVGSTTNQLLREGSCSTLVVPAGFEAGVTRRILVPVDGSRVSRATLASAAVLARRLGASVTVLHALGQLPLWLAEPELPYLDAHRTVELLLEGRRDWLTNTVAEMGIRDVVDHIKIVPDDVAYTIARVSQDLKPDLICMGSHGARGVRRFVLGTTAERILRRAPCPVLVLCEEAREPLRV